MANPLWSSLAARANVSLTKDQLDQLDRYIDELLAANQRMNLTRIDTRDAAEIGHVADALALLPYLPAAAHAIADVGSGGGIPGIVLAIARPDARVLLIDSTQKKAKFLAETAQHLGLSNVIVSSRRAEEEARDAARREAFDVVTARALAEMRVLVEWCLPLAKTGGRVLAMKGAKVADELHAAGRAVRGLGGGEPRVHPAELPGAEHHVIVEVAKVARTDRRYPRPPQQVRDTPL